VVPTGKLLEGYNQTYIIRKRAGSKSKKKSSAGGRGRGAKGEFGGDADELDDADLYGDGDESASASDSSGDEDDATACERHVMFRCGNWCYVGHIMLDSKRITLMDVPRLIPLLQKQQNRLHFFCNADAMPRQSDFKVPTDVMAEASEFTAQELASQHTHDQLVRSSEFLFRDAATTEKTYFELAADDLPSCMYGDIDVIASKTCVAATAAAAAAGGDATALLPRPTHSPPPGTPEDSSSSPCTSKGTSTCPSRTGTGTSLCWTSSFPTWPTTARACTWPRTAT